jgi:eukaryotic-like serine/threonine-protein kinase
MFEFPNPNDEEATDRFIFQVSRKFEVDWHEKRESRIEGMIQAIRNEREDSKALHPSVLKKLVAELIRVEMDLRTGKGEAIDELEYLNRFPDFSRVVEEAWENLLSVYSRRLLLCSTVVVTKVTGKSSGASHGIETVLTPKGHDSLPTAIGPFEEIEQIGSGGFGIVCKAVDSRFRRTVALKLPYQRAIPDDQVLQMFVDEAERVKTMDHPGIVKTLSLETELGYLVIVQEFVPGQSLRKTIGNRRSGSEIANLVAKIADALAYSHNFGIIHRDIKPSNCLWPVFAKPRTAL